MSDNTIEKQGVGAVSVTNFVIADWVLNGSDYEIEITHNLNTSTPDVRVYRNNEEIFTNYATVVNSNIILISVPMEPDLRFDGVVSISKV